MRWAVAIALTLAIASLYAERIESPKGQEARLALETKPSASAALLPLPVAQLPSSQLLSRVEVLSPPPPRRVTLAWECLPVAFPLYYQTGIEGSTNLRDWYELARLPYQLNNTVTLTNRPPIMEFYRAFNCLTRSLAIAEPQSPVFVSRNR